MTQSPAITSNQYHPQGQGIYATLGSYPSKYNDLKPAMPIAPINSYGNNLGSGVYQHSAQMDVKPTAMYPTSPTTAHNAYNPPGNYNSTSGGSHFSTYRAVMPTATNTFAHPFSHLATGAINPSQQIDVKQENRNLSTVPIPHNPLRYRPNFGPFTSAAQMNMSSIRNQSFHPRGNQQMYNRFNAPTIIPPTTRNFASRNGRFFPPPPSPSPPLDYQIPPQVIFS